MNRPPLTTPRSKAPLMIGSILLIIVLVGVGGFLVYWFGFRDDKGDSGNGDNGNGNGQNGNGNGQNGNGNGNGNGSNGNDKDWWQKDGSCHKNSSADGDYVVCDRHQILSRYTKKLGNCWNAAQIGGADNIEDCLQKCQTESGIKPLPTNTANYDSTNEVPCHCPKTWTKSYPFQDGGENPGGGQGLVIDGSSEPSCYAWGTKSQQVAFRL